MIERIPTLVSGAVEPVSVDFIGQNKVTIFGLVKICQNCM